MADAGIKLTVEGEKEFKKAITDINAVLKLNQAEMQKAVAEFNGADKSLEELTGATQEAQKAVEDQTKVVGKMKEEYERLVDQYGENDRGTVKMKTELDKATTSLETMKKQAAGMREELDAQAKAIEAADEAVANFDKQLAELQAELQEDKKAVSAASAELYTYADREEDAGEKTDAFKEKSKNLNEQIRIQSEKIEALNQKLAVTEKRYGANSEQAQKLRDEVNSTSSAVENMQNELSETNKEIGKNDTSAQGLLGTFTEIANAAGIQIPSGISEIAAGLSGATTAAGGLVGALVKMEQKIDEIKKQLNDDANAENENTLKLSKEYGISTDAVQEWEYTAKQLNISFETIGGALQTLQQNMNDALLGDAEMQVALFELGTWMYDTEGNLRDVNDVFLDVIEGLGDITDKAERAAKMEEILGSSSNDLNELVMTGAEGLRIYRENAQELFVVDEELINLSERKRQSQERLNAALEKGKNLLGMRSEYLKAWLRGEMSFGDAVSGEWNNEVGQAKAWWTLLKEYIGQIKGAANATGTYNWRGGYTLVGEQGPEIVDLPAGSRIYPNGQYPESGSVNNYYVRIDASSVREFNDIVRMAQTARMTERMNG